MSLDSTGVVSVPLSSTGPSVSSMDPVKFIDVYHSFDSSLFTLLVSPCIGEGLLFVFLFGAHAGYYTVTFHGVPMGGVIELQAVSRIWEENS